MEMFLEYVFMGDAFYCLYSDMLHRAHRVLLHV